MNTIAGNQTQASAIITDVMRDCKSRLDRFLDARRQQRQDLRRIRKLATMGDASLSDIGLIRADIHWISRMSMSDQAYAELAERARIKPLM